MNLHDQYCPRKNCRGGYIRDAIFDSDTNRWTPLDYRCDWMPSEKLQRQLYAEALGGGER